NGEPCATLGSWGCGGPLTRQVTRFHWHFRTKSSSLSPPQHTLYNRSAMLMGGVERGRERAGAGGAANEVVPQYKQYQPHDLRRGCHGRRIRGVQCVVRHGSYES